MSRVLGASLVGVDGLPVEVEVRLSSQLPRVDVVGLPEAAVRESAARVRAALSTTGVPFPDRRVTVNLAPASRRKSGGGLDLPIAVGIVAAAGRLPPEGLERTALFGELALDGRLRSVPGALALALAVRDAGARRLVAPAACAGEAALAPGLEVHAADDLGAVLRHLSGEEILPACEPPPFRPDGRGGDAATGGSEAPTGARARGACLSDVRGQARARRALEVAAAGGHALLLHGAPGSGKTMLAHRLPGILPPLDLEEALEATRIHGAAGRLPEGACIVTSRPFRAPHHSASAAGLLGGGSPPRPGEVSLAHRGVLFLDELPEFARPVLESLRQVLEERRVHVARARASCVFPADFQLVAAANPCPCGWYRSARRDCRCDPGAVARYRARISGPLLDRVDLHVHVPAVRWRELEGSAPGPTSDEARERVVAARRRQARRGPEPNAAIPDRDLEDRVRPTGEARVLLGRAVDRLGLTARAARRVLKVARSVADLAGEARVGPPHVAEALGFRDLDAPGD